MQLRVSTRVISFVLAVKRHLSRFRLTFDEFMLQFKLANSRLISQGEFARIVQRINEDGERFNPFVLFEELAEGRMSIPREALTSAFFRVFRVDHMQLQGESMMIKAKLPRPESDPLVERGKQLAEAGFNNLCRHMAKAQMHLEKVFGDCDLDRSGFVERNEFNKLLYASGIPQFRHKDTRRYLVMRVFNNIKGGRLSRSEFFKLFDPSKVKKQLYGYGSPRTTVKKVNIRTTKAMPLQNSSIKPILKARNEVSLQHPEMKLGSTANTSGLIKGNLSSNLTLLQVHSNLENNTKAYPQAGKYYRLGAASTEDSPFIEELQLLLKNKKTYIDPQNPAIDVGEYTFVGKIFGSQKYDLFELSQQQMNRERRTSCVSQFIEATDILQGSVGDCYYLSAICSLAADYPELISEKFLFQANPAGYNAVRLFIDGEWKIIKNDDLYPFYEGAVLYAKPHSCETWVMLLEKAYAKIFGSYQAIDGGTSEQAFFALTGAPSIYIDLEKEGDLEVLKGKVEQADKNGFLMATAGNNYLDGLSQKAKEDLGLISGHAYSLIFIKDVGKETFVKLRNPWGNFVWKGKWSFKSPLWTPELRKSLDYEKQIQNGIFYMAWKDYCSYYGSISICKINPVNVHSSFRMANNQKKSNYIRLTVATQGKYDIFICQENPRKYAADANFQSSNSRLIIMKEGKDGILTFVAGKSACQEQICNVEAVLDPGTYVVSAKVIWKNWPDHECFLTAYGIEKVSFEAINRTIATQFKKNLIESYSALKAGAAEIGSYQSSGFKNLVTQTYFSMEEGIGYIKTSNKTNKNFNIQTTYQLTGLKIIKPKTNPYVLDLRAGQVDLLGFMVSAEGYQYSYTYALSTAK